MGSDQKRPGGDLRGRRVLIVEDEMLVAMELESVLKQQGCAVLGPVPTVARALALLDHERPEAALLDLNLNGESAIPVAAALSAHGVPFVLVTGFGQTQSQEPELRGAPRVDKPVDDGELVRTLAWVLDIS
jgi:DNA-binding response OmpR family regulator